MQTRTIRGCVESKDEVRDFKDPERSPTMEEQDRSVTWSEVTSDNSVIFKPDNVIENSIFDTICAQDHVYQKYSYLSGKKAHIGTSVLTFCETYFALYWNFYWNI